MTLFFNHRYMYKSIRFVSSPYPYLDSAHKRGSCSIGVLSVFNDSSEERKKVWLISHYLLATCTELYMKVYYVQFIHNASFKF